jgi:hypothetical protein
MQITLLAVLLLTCAPAFPSGGALAKNPEVLVVARQSLAQAAPVLSSDLEKLAEFKLTNWKLDITKLLLNRQPRASIHQCKDRKRFAN